MCEWSGPSTKVHAFMLVSLVMPSLICNPVPCWCMWQRFFLNDFRFAIEHCISCYGDRLEEDMTDGKDAGMYICHTSTCMHSTHTSSIWTSCCMCLMAGDWKCYFVCVCLAEVYYAMSELKVCQFYAELLLRPAETVTCNQCVCVHVCSAVPGTYGAWCHMNIHMGGGCVLLHNV